MDENCGADNSISIVVDRFHHDKETSNDQANPEAVMMCSRNEKKITPMNPTPLYIFFLFSLT